MIQTTGIVTVIISVLVALLAISSKFINKLANRGAEKAARKFCKQSNLQFIGFHELQDHYEVYYQKEGDLYTSKFHFESDGAIVWIKSVI